MSMRSLLEVVSCAALLFGCAASPPPTAPPAETPPGTSPSETPPPAENASRPEVTAEQCEAQGGTVVGDIGDGATHRSDYVCPSGAAPTGSITAPQGGPIGVEGAVCCPKQS